MPRSSTNRSRSSELDPLELMQGLWALVHALDVRSKRMFRTMGVTGPQRLVLRVIGQHPTATAGDIASMLALHASTLTGILARLQAGGLIRRQADPRDLRRARFALTAAGAAIGRVRRGTVEAAVERTLAKTSRAQHAACVELLRVLATELEGDD